jgi:O-antigen/teichoic acid export membrane protein
MSEAVRRPSRVEINVVANLLGTGAIVIIGLAFVPIYARLLGIEAYGLIGFNAALLGAAQILDLGLSPTINRELARISALPAGAAGIARDLVRTLEVPYWVLGLAVGACLALAAPSIAHQWLNVSSLPVASVQTAVVLMGVAFVLQWPISLYQGGLQGLQRQPLVNAINASFALFRNLGAVWILTAVSATVEGFFRWQVLAYGLQVVVLMVSLWLSLPDSPHRPRFSVAELRRIWRFTAGMSVIAVTGIILIQVDRVVLSRQLDLTDFGYYALASVVGMSLAYAVGPVFNAVFPRFSALVARDERQALTHLYHRSTQFLAVILLPAASTLAILAADIMRLWTGDASTAEQTHLVVSLLAVGSAINGLMTMPYALQLAHGWTSLGIRINIFLICLAVPAVVILGGRFGGPGAASIWIVTNAVYMIIGVPATHRRLMPGEARRWILVDVGGPLCASLAVVLAGRFLTDPLEGRLLEAARIGLILLTSVIAAILAAPMMRERSASFVRRLGAAALGVISNESIPR